MNWSPTYVKAVELLHDGIEKDPANIEEARAVFQDPKYNGGRYKGKEYAKGIGALTPGENYDAAEAKIKTGDSFWGDTKEEKDRRRIEHLANKLEIADPNKVRIYPLYSRIGRLWLI